MDSPEIPPKRGATSDLFSRKGLIDVTWMLGRYLALALQICLEKNLRCPQTQEATRKPKANQKEANKSHKGTKRKAQGNRSREPIKKNTRRVRWARVKLGYVSFFVFSTSCEAARSGGEGGEAVRALPGGAFESVFGRCSTRGLVPVWPVWPVWLSHMIRSGAPNTNPKKGPTPPHV